MRKLTFKRAKFLYVISFLIFFQSPVFGTTWYSDILGGNPNDVTRWWSKSNGTGVHPSNFIDSNDIFYLKNGHTYSTINSWNIGGTLQVYGELTIQHPNKIKSLVVFSNGLVIGNAQTTIYDEKKGGSFVLKNGGKYIFNHTTTNNYLTLFAGVETFDVSSVLEFQDFENTNGAFSMCIANSSCKFGSVCWNIKSGNTAYNLNYNTRVDRAISGDFNLIQTGLFGSVTWCNNSDVARFVIEGNYIQSGGRFYVQRNSVGSDSCVLVIQKDFSLQGGVFDLGTSENFSTTLELYGSLTITNGKFYRSCNSPKKKGILAFKGIKDQVYKYVSGEVNSENIVYNIGEGANLVLNSNLQIDCSLVVSRGGTLTITHPFAVIGNGTCEILSGGKLSIGNLEGITFGDSKGGIQTATRLYHSEMTLEYIGNSFQRTGDACISASHLVLNNSTGIEFTTDMTIQNGGSLTLRKGYHDLNGKVLTLGTSADSNKLVYEDGGLYSKNNLGVFKRWVPSIVLAGNSGNNYGFFPFAKSPGQIGFVSFSTSDSLLGGILAIMPIFENDVEITCNVKDSSRTLCKIQKAFAYKIIENTLSSGNRITMEYMCGNVKNGSVNVSTYGLAVYTNSGVLIPGQYTQTLGSQKTPKVRRTFNAWQEIILNGLFVLGTFDPQVSLKIECNLSGIKSVGPTGDYARITDALNAISENGLNSSLILELQSAYSSTNEVYPLKINSFSCLGASNRLLIRPAEDAKNLVIGKSIDNTIIHLNQADFVTIDGRPASKGDVSQITVQNSNPLGSTLLLSMGATYNTLKYINIEGAQTTNSRGIIEFTSFFGSGNNYDTISNCMIKNCNGQTITNAIYARGDGASKNNEFNYLLNNQFVNCTSAGIFLDLYNHAWIIKGNNFYQTNSFKPTATVYGIHIVNQGSGYLIEGNFMGGQSANCKGGTYTLNVSPNHFFPIYLSVTGSNMPNIIQFNTITNITVNNSDGSATNPGVFTGIYIFGVPTTNSCIIRGNKIGDSSSITTGQIKISSTINGALIQGIVGNCSGKMFVHENLITNISTLNSENKGYVFYGIRSMGNGDCFISDNTIGSKNNANAIQIGGQETGNINCVFYGINNTNLGRQIITNNEIFNCSVYGLGASKIYGIYTVSSNAELLLSYNTIGTLGNLAKFGENLQALSVGIYQDGGSNITICSNNILAFDVNNGFFKGIYLTNTSGNAFVTSNVIAGISKQIRITSRSFCNTFSTNVINNHGGIVINATCNACQLINNTISEINCVENISYVVGGIVVGFGSKSTINITSNLIEKIGASNPGLFSSEIFGIYYGNFSSVTNTIKKNRIRNMYNINGAISSIYGLQLFVGNQRIINNFISIKNFDGDKYFDNAVSLHGLQLTNSINTQSISVYYNTIEIGGYQAQGTQNSFAIHHNTTISEAKFLYTNNVFQNARNTNNGNHYVVFTNVNGSQNQIFRNNYFVGTSSQKFAFISSEVTLDDFLLMMNSNQNQNSRLSVFPFLIDMDGASLDVSKFTPAANLNNEPDCSEDINGVVGGRNGENLENHMGCFEGPVNVFYSVSEEDSRIADDVKNWNTKKDGSGIYPQNFNEMEKVYIIQKGHKYKLLTNWLGNLTSTLIIDSGGVLDLNAKTITNWKEIQVQGIGINNSGVIINSSSTTSTSQTPIVLISDVTVNSIGKGGIVFLGGFSLGNFQLTLAGDPSIFIQEMPITGIGGITKAGTGTLYLKNQNLFSGKTFVNEGVVNVKHGGAFGLNARGVEVKSGASVELQNGIIVQDSLWIQGNSNAEIEVIRNLGGENTWNGTIVLHSENARIKVSEGMLNLSNCLLQNDVNLIFDGDGSVKCGLVVGKGTLTKDGKGDLFLTKSNTYEGSLRLFQGKVVIGAPQCITHGDLDLIGGVFDANGFTIKTNGNWKNSGAEYIDRQNNVIMSGANTSIVCKTRNDFYRLTIDSNVYLAGNIKVKNKLVLHACLILEKFDVEIDTTATIEGYTNTSFIVTNDSGKLTCKQIGLESNLEAQIFPVGFSPNKQDYTPCHIKNKGNTSDFSVRMGKERLENGYQGSPKLDNGVDRTWFISTNTDGVNADITLQWSIAREQANFSRLSATIGHFNGLSWEYDADNIPSKSTEPYTFSQTRSNITSFSPFIVENATALPIRLVYFNATIDSQKVRLDWQTSSEHNNASFTIERSQDGSIYEQIFSKSGKGESKTNSWYSTFDTNPHKGVGYYRLKQTDFDGKYTYSEIVSVNFTNEQSLKLNVFPNPISDNHLEFTYLSEINDLIQIIIFNPFGEIIYKDNINVKKGENTIKNEILLSSTGIYIIKIGNESVGFETRMFSNS